MNFSNSENSNRQYSNTPSHPPSSTNCNSELKSDHANKLPHD